MNKGLCVLLSYSQAGPDRTVKQEQEEISRNHVQTFISPSVYRDRLKGVHILLSNSQAGPGRTVKQEQEEISRNHVQAFILGSVHTFITENAHLIQKFRNGEGAMGKFSSPSGQLLHRGSGTIFHYFTLALLVV